MPTANRYLVTLSDETIARPEETREVLDTLHHLVGSSGEVLDSAPDDRTLIEALGTVVVEAPSTLKAQLEQVPGVARVDDDSFRERAP
ncbi:hypothetical protein V5F53_07605 [Xanthobacter sp. V4C-4]|uniref:hypothetical protein n=1 Tax=Xanthobacter cornucopiae TaxID=3119924 RepID=UPI003727245A